MPAPRTRRTNCKKCGKSVPAYDLIHSGSRGTGYRRICSRCANAEIADFHRVKFEHVDFEPVELVDCDGVARTFCFHTYFFGLGVSMDAFEVRDGQRSGYQFAVIDKPGINLRTLHAKLIGKIRRGISSKHLKEGKQGLTIASHKTVRAGIAWDQTEDGRVPMLMIDGREVTWAEFGRILMTFEGWQFKLEIHDKCDEV